MSKIINLSEAVSIALHSMVLLIKTNKKLSVEKIAKITSTSKNHVSKVMQRLKKAGYVNSERGPKGGFILLEKAEELTLLEIYESIEGELKITVCPLNKKICPFNKCITENLTQKLTLEFKTFLQTHTLKDFAKNKEK